MEKTAEISQGDIKLPPDLQAKPQLNPSIKAIKDSGVLRVGLAYPDNLPLYGHNKSGDLVGYDVEMARGMARSLNVEAIFSQPEVTYTRLIELASADQIDIAIGKLSLTIPRLGYAEAVPYMNLRQSLLINRKVLQSIVSDPNNIGPSLKKANMRIGVISGSSHAMWGPNSFPRATFIAYPNWQSCIASLMSGNVDAVFRDGFETSRLVKGKPRLALDYVPVILKDRIDQIAIFMGPRMHGLQNSAQLYIGITSGIVGEEDLFRQFKNEMKQDVLMFADEKSLKTPKGASKAQIQEKS